MSLKKQAAPLRRSIQHSRTLTRSYISRLPPELLLEIFESCLPPFPLSHSDQVSFHPYIPHHTDNDIYTGVDTFVAVKLSHVSRAWRSLTLSNPKLWSRIIILAKSTDKLSHPWETTPSRLINALTHFLKHSQEHPLQILFQSIYSNKDTLRILHPLKLLFDQSRRWDRVHFSLFGTQIARLIFPTLFPLLRSFTLYNEAGFWATVPPVFSAPRLELLRLKRLDIADTDFHRAYPHLVDLSMAHYEVSECISALATASPSMSMTFKNMYLGSDVPNLTPIISLASELRVESNDDFQSGFVEALESLLGQISSMLSLHTLAFTKSPAQLGLFPTTAFKSFLSRRQASDSAITQLLLGQWMLDRNLGLIEVLTLLPSLTHLTLDECPPSRDVIRSVNAQRLISDQLLRALELPALESESDMEITCLLPRLTHLSLSFFDFEGGCNFQILLSMIQSRRSPARITATRVARLQQLEITTAPELLAAEDREILLALREGDFDVQCRVICY
ncbi:hypothetical protein D9758_015689 [Tetrapyrgos nigripes]|uniref:F-box domain-containing protein n=1 Tax=Tetrapyrgos nigripes TaxID=182062 RepID=A0A8H5C7Q9_9AGAR|nr:hypothetical protein D9758_015689 [Tetrapyrgos nigripes]